MNIDPLRDMLRKLIDEARLNEASGNQLDRALPSPLVFIRPGWRHAATQGRKLIIQSGGHNSLVEPYLEDKYDWVGHGSVDVGIGWCLFARMYVFFLNPHEGWKDA